MVAVLSYDEKCKLLVLHESSPKTHYVPRPQHPCHLGSQTHERESKSRWRACLYPRRKSFQGGWKPADVLMKVCHFYASGGLRRGHTCIDLVNALVPDYDVALVAPRGAGLTEIVDKRVAVFEYGSRNIRANPFLHWELYRIFKSIRPDIVHTHFGKATGIFYLLNKALGIRHVATKHNPRKGRIYKAGACYRRFEGCGGQHPARQRKNYYNGIHPSNCRTTHRKQRIYHYRRRQAR